MNWFYDMFMAGVEHNPYFASFRFPSYANPYLPPGEVESLKQDMSVAFTPKGGCPLKPVSMRTIASQSLGVHR
jgi:hypothetical protein